MVSSMQVSDGIRNDNEEDDDPRALTFEEDEGEETMPHSPGAPNGGIFDQEWPEVDAFAFALNSSNLLQFVDPNSVQAALSGYDLIERFKNLSGTQLDEVKAAHMSELSHESTADVAHWELEHQTWELFGTLSSHRLDGRIQAQDLPVELANNKHTSNQRLRQHLRETDAKFQEWCLILQWLCTYAPDPSDLFDNVEEIGGKGGWMYTKESLKAEKRLRGKRGKATLAFGARGGGRPSNKITELDPDAPSRQQKQLESEDEDSERFLFKAIWVFLRKGDLKGAKDLCAEMGEFWRAASLDGGEEVWDPMVDGQRFDNQSDEESMDMSENSQAEGVTGNRRRELWKRMCYAIAHRSGAEDCEKAVYGTLCGDFESVLPVCVSWEDHLFAHMNSLVEEYYSQYLLRHGRLSPAALSFPAFDSTAFHSRVGSLAEDDAVLSRIIDSLATLDYVKAESRVPLRVIQGSLMSLRFHELVDELYRQLLTFRDNPDYDPLHEEGSIGVDVTDCRTLRIVVHILLVLQLLNAGFTEDTPFHTQAEFLIAAYIEFLAEAGKLKLIPLYAGRLSPQKAIDVMGVILNKIREEPLRLELLELMRTHNIDYVGCLKKGMEIAFDLTKNHYENERRHVATLSVTAGEILEEDNLLIQGLEWLVLGGEELKAESVGCATVIYKRLLLSGRLAAAKRVSQTIRSTDLIPEGGDVNHFSSEGIMEDGEIRGVFDSEVDQWALAVLVEMEVFIQALDELEAWNELLGQKTDRHPDRARKAALSEAYNSTNHKLGKVLRTWLDEALITVPPFPSQSHIIDPSSIVALRNMYIPELTFALHDVYIMAGKYVSKNLLGNTLDLATVVADPNRSVLKCFTETARVEEYLRALGLASRSVLGISGVSPEKNNNKLLGIWKVR
ncbi:nuclear pore protein 84/107 [Choiromyces venosus 120613-1]|uniref:Nuclear pore complex protein n=1 Tax=Choiromyces venosus 120613-1 TaxID=1336337 RepID=A0A3N4JKK8_9PEZI|nr:nuclear pore protein 84/107 [Choiromyces venosus 120613-1]